MKTKPLYPIVSVCAVNVQCPACVDFFPAPCGSMFWTAHEVKPGSDHTCGTCGAVVTFPFRLPRVSW